MTTIFDISGKVGDLGSDADWPMFSYERPAYMLWNAVGRELFQQGWTEAQVKEWLQSKGPRWALDADLGDEIEKIGQAFAVKLATGGNGY